MTTFPLIRTKWSSEHIMAELFFVLLLYLLPGWIKSPSSILGFLAVLSLGLFIDTSINYIRYKKPICAVSAAVTAAILDILTPGIPLSGKLMGIAFALIIGKHIWGGTGKNILNPGVTGLLFVSMIFDIKSQAPSPTFLLFLALLLSLRFITFRPFAALGIMAGMVLALAYRQELSLNQIVTYGVVFWGCILATDPVTVTPNPYFGLILGLLSGLIPLLLGDVPFYMALGLLLLNIASYALDIFSVKPLINPARYKIKRAIPYFDEDKSVKDLTEQENSPVEKSPTLEANEILRRIQHNGVFGMGGGAFPTFQKINTAIMSNAADKHLIINGVECDPGLIHDKWILKSFPDEICKGIELLSKCISFKSVTIAVKSPKGLNFPDNLKVYTVSDYYPAGAEKHLIKEVLNIKLPYDAVPASQGILVLNVQTVYSIYEAVIKNLKINARYLTLANIKEGAGMVVRVPLESRVMEIVNSIYPQYSFAFCGGGVMQCHTATEDEVIGKNINFIAVSDFPHYKESYLCSKCSFCNIRCPEGLRVNKIAELVDNNELDKLNPYHPERCLSCGICSFGCPAGKNLSSRVKTAKEYIINS